MNIFTKGTIGVFETLGSEYASRVVALSGSSTGYVFSALGACGAITLIYFSRLVKHHDEVRLTISGIYLMILSCIMMSLTPLAVTMDATGQHAIYSPLVTLWFLLAVSAMYATGTSFHFLSRCSVYAFIVMLCRYTCMYQAIQWVTLHYCACSRRFRRVGLKEDCWAGSALRVHWREWCFPSRQVSLISCRGGFV